jgi:hypothetical protein
MKRRDVLTTVSTVATVGRVATVGTTASVPSAIQVPAAPEGWIDCPVTIGHGPFRKLASEDAILLAR